MQIFTAYQALPLSSVSWQQYSSSVLDNQEISQSILVNVQQTHERKEQEFPHSDGPVLPQVRMTLITILTSPQFPQHLPKELREEEMEERRNWELRLTQGQPLPFSLPRHILLWTPGSVCSLTPVMPFTETMGNYLLCSTLLRHRAQISLCSMFLS